jgi:DNA-binding response OmpR family regulator
MRKTQWALGSPLCKGGFQYEDSPVSEPQISVVLIEDDKEIRRFVRSVLGTSGFQVWEAETAERGLVEAATRQPELVILDLGLPDRDGLDVIRDLRTWTAIPILILSARDEETQKVAALDAGADDYLTKPFGVPELLARMRALLRRATQLQGDTGNALVEFGNLRIDLAHRTVTRGGEAVHLTPIEYRMLTVLLTHAGRVLTHRQLLKEVWGPGHVERIHYLRVFMAGLRRKLEDEPARPKHLLTVSGVGYRLEIETLTQ